MRDKFFTTPADDFAKHMQACARAAEAHSGHALHLESTANFNDTLRAARFRLDNGLRVVMMPDQRAPVFAYQTWFGVGSRDEDPDHTGIAHLFEHLMFKGTKRFAQGVFDTEMEQRGAQTNAATWVDWTAYTEALATQGDNLATVIAFEADRMLGLVLDEETFRSELEVVKNERRMAVEDSVAGMVTERLFSLAYQRHPYRWPTIGSMAHLEATTLDELQDFYRRFYSPNNAVVVVVGDLDPTDVLTQVAGAYGAFAPQDIERRPREAEPAQNAPRLEHMRAPMATPMVAMAYHIPPQDHRDHPALEVIADALTIGDSARLYRRLVIDEKLATNVDGFVTPFADPGLFEISINAREGADPMRIVEVVQEELDALSQGLTPLEREKAQNDIEISTWMELKDAEGCADALGHFETNFSDYRLAFSAMDRVQAVQPEDLVRVAQVCLGAHNRSTVIAVPES